MYFAGGVGHGVNPPDPAPPERISMVADDPGPYDSYRQGNFAYRVPLPNGRYPVVLKFAEPAQGTAGACVFDVAANGVF